jgi:hypothetical protein
LNKIHPQVSIKTISKSLTSGIGIYLPLKEYKNKEDMWYDVRGNVKKLRWDIALKHSTKLMNNTIPKEQAIKKHNREFREKHDEKFNDIIMSKDIKLA